VGTRADFYVGRGVNAEWLGSIAYDGFPDNEDVLGVVSKTEAVFRERIQSMLDRKEDSTTPDQGWPWPWDDSHLTDYSYAFDNGKVYGSAFGSEWFIPPEEPEDLAEHIAVFPDMKDRRNLARAGTKRSGVMVFTAPR
jgi:hypothetical protein